MTAVPLVEVAGSMGALDPVTWAEKVGGGATGLLLLSCCCRRA